LDIAKINIIKYFPQPTGGDPSTPRKSPVRTSGSFAQRIEPLPAGRQGSANSFQKTFLGLASPDRVIPSPKNVFEGKWRRCAEPLGSPSSLGEELPVPEKIFLGEGRGSVPDLDG